jgi:hypothetical protein
MERVSAAEHSAEPGWFSVRCVFQWDDEPPVTYEERITLWRAGNFEEAIALAEAEAADYAQMLNFRYLGLAQAYQLSDEVGHGAEVFSLIRDNDLSPEDYLSRFFDTGSEHQGNVDEPPAAHSAQ